LKPTKDIELYYWKQLKKGSKNALGKLYDRYADELFVYGMQFCQDRALVLDAIHDLFLNLFKYHSNLAETDNVEFYLLRSLKNNVIKSIKKNQKLSSLSQAKKEIKSDFNFEEHWISTETQHEHSHKLAKALSLLSEKQRKSLFLRFTEGYTYDEIATMMNISVQSARTNIYRSIKMLRRNLQMVFLSL